MSPDLAETVKRLRELLPKATPGNWGVEDPMAPECLSVVANPGAQVYAWVFICNLMMPDEDDHDLTSADVRANAAYIAAANPAAISSILDALEGLERDNASLRNRLRISQDQYAEADFASIQRGEGSLSGFKP